MSELLERLASALGDRYAVESEIGSGGMATVYLAEDLKHRRKVAIKVLHPSLAQTVGADRFLAEIETVAALNHPHVLPLYDSGEANGLLFYVMPYVKGESLRQRLDRERQLPVNEAIRLAAEIADGLDYAHRQGVVHRDIKPGNVLLSEGHAVLADFGIARAITVARAERMTGTGIGVGTPLYASPEQASGDETLDGRSDIYSLGCVLYEMLSGEVPLYGATPQSIQAKRLSETPTALVLLRETVPPALDGTVARALAKVPADRWATAAEFKEALHTSRLAATPGFASTPFDLAASTSDPGAPSRPARGKRRVPAWLLVAVPVAVAAAVYAGMGGGFGSDAPHQPTDEDRMQAQVLVNDGAGALLQATSGAPEQEVLFLEALEKYQAAADLDPGQAEAYAGIARVYGWLGITGTWPRARAYPPMEAAALRAIEIDPSSADAHRALGTKYWVFDWEWQKARDEYLRAVELAPEHAEAGQWLCDAAVIQADLGNADAAVALLRPAVGSDPRGRPRDCLVTMLFLTPRFEEAAAEARLAIQDGNPNSRGLRLNLAHSLIELGRFDEALRVLEALSRPSPLTVAYLHARRGDAERALQLLEQVRSDRGQVHRESDAKIHAWVGDTDRALDLLEEQVAAQGFVFRLPSDPAFKPLRDDPRFHRMLGKMGLACRYFEGGHKCAET